MAGTSGTLPDWYRTRTAWKYRNTRTSPSTASGYARIPTG